MIDTKKEKQRKFLVFEGISGSGKTTLEDLYRATNKYWDYTMHRFTASKYVYAKIYNRELSITNLNRTELAMNRLFDVRVILCVVNPTLAYQRKIELHDKNIEESLDKCQEYFKEYVFNHSKFSKYLVVNTEKSIAKCMEDILTFIDIP